MSPLPGCQSIASLPVTLMSGEILGASRGKYYQHATPFHVWRTLY